MAQSVLVKNHLDSFSFLRTSEVKTVTIGASGTVSGAVDVSGYNHIGFVMPSAWDTADVKLSACDTADGTFLAVYDEDGEFGVTGGTNRVLSIPHVIAPLTFVKVVASATQTSARTIKLLLSR